jgi:hypothetical protein
VTAPVVSEHTPPWFAEALLTVSLTGLYHLLQGAMALAAGAAAIISVWIAYQRYQWERADRAERTAERREDLADRRDGRYARHLARVEHAEDRKSATAHGLILPANVDNPGSPA